MRRPGPAPSKGACFGCQARSSSPRHPKGKGAPGGKKGDGRGAAGGRDPPAPWVPRPSGAAVPPAHVCHRTACAQAAHVLLATAATPPGPRKHPCSPPPCPPSLQARSAATCAARCPGAPALGRRALLPSPCGARPHRTWAGSGTRNWTGCPPPPRPRAAGLSGRPWPLRPRRPRRLTAAARPAPGAGVGCPPRPARPRPRRCGSGGGEPPARRAPSSAGPRGGASARGAAGGPGAPPPQAA